MSVTAQIPYNSYNYVGSTTFVFNFLVLNSSDLIVTVDGIQKTLGVDYTISGVGVGSGGSINYTGALTLGQQVVLKRSTVRTRTTDYQNNGDLPAVQVNGDFDRLWMAMQEIDAGGSGDAVTLQNNLASSSVGKGSKLVAFMQRLTGAVMRWVEDKLGESVSVNDFGADPTGVLDSSPAINAALAACNRVKLTRGQYKVNSPITNAGQSYKRLIGDGKGSTIIKNYGTGHAISFGSLGGASPTPVGLAIRGLSVDGQNVGKGIHLYDATQSEVDSVEVYASTEDGILAEMLIDSQIERCVCTSNARDGIRVSDGVKAAVEFNSNQVSVSNCTGYSNAGAGINVVRSRRINIIGGEHSANAIGVLLTGAERCLVTAAWVENNSSYSLHLLASTSGLGVTYQGNANTIRDLMLTGTGTVAIDSGSRNALEFNYLGHAISIGASCSDTYFGKQTFLGGALTDSGSGTINEHNPADSYIKTSGLKRWQHKIGSTVDITSDIQSIRVGQVKGLSSSGTLSNNFTGFVDIANAATSAAVSFATNEADAAYGVLYGVVRTGGTPAAGSESVFTTARAMSGFTVNLVTAPGAGNTVRIFWMLVR